MGFSMNEIHKKPEVVHMIKPITKKDLLKLPVSTSMPMMYNKQYIAIAKLVILAKSKILFPIVGGLK